jgi:hypothetical protein
MNPDLLALLAATDPASGVPWRDWFAEVRLLLADALLDAACDSLADQMRDLSAIYAPNYPERITIAPPFRLDEWRLEASLDCIVRWWRVHFLEGERVISEDCMKGGATAAHRHVYPLECHHDESFACSIVAMDAADGADAPCVLTVNGAEDPDGANWSRHLSFAMLPLSAPQNNCRNRLVAQIREALSCPA